MSPNDETTKYSGTNISEFDYESIKKYVETFLGNQDGKFEFKELNLQ